MSHFEALGTWDLRINTFFTAWSALSEANENTKQTKNDETNEKKPERIFVCFVIFRLFRIFIVLTKSRPRLKVGLPRKFRIPLSIIIIHYPLFHSSLNACHKRQPLVCLKLGVSLGTRGLNG